MAKIEPDDDNKDETAASPKDADETKVDAPLELTAGAETVVDVDYEEPGENAADASSEEEPTDADDSAAPQDSSATPMPRKKAPLRLGMFLFIVIVLIGAGASLYWRFFAAPAAQSPEAPEAQEAIVAPSDAAAVSEPELSLASPETDAQSSRALADSANEALVEIARLEARLAEETARSTNLEQEVQALRTALEETRQAAATAQAALIAARDNAQAAAAAAEAQAARVAEANVSQTEGPPSLAALDNIAASLKQGQPYTAYLAILEEALPGEPAIDALGGYAVSSAPTDANLIAELPEATRRALTASTLEAAPDGGVGRLLAEARNLVSVRPVQPGDADTPANILSRAENAANDGDFITAVQEIDALPDVAKDAMGSWLVDAKTRAALDAAVETIRNRLSPQSSPTED